MELKLLDDFPGNANAPKFIEKIIVENNIKNIADIGGGAKPLLPLELVQKYGLNYYVLDIDMGELAKAPSWCKRLKVDIASRDKNFIAPDMLESFDLVFSHMLLEHIKDATQAHKNIAMLLKKSGMAVHFFPSPHNLPLFVNRIVPEWLSRKLVEFFQPNRDRVYDVKFPAYYVLCGTPSKRLMKIFRSLGYMVEEHVGYIGHNYYERFFVTRKMELFARRLILRLNLPLTSTVHIVLRKVI
jgi:SAM-dependent methyltransferase